MDAFLLRALRIVIAADSDPVRQALFTNLRQSRAAVRLAYALHERLAGTSAGALFVSGYGLAFYLAIAAPPRRAPVVAVAGQANARRQIARVAAWLGAGQCDAVRSGLRRLLTPSRLLALLLPSSSSGFMRAFRVIRAIDRRHGFLVSSRAACALAWYSRGKAMLEDVRPRAVVVSSDSNPEEVGFAAAARAIGVPTVFISHAYPTPFSPPLDFSLSILGGDAEVSARRKRGEIRGDVLLAGVEGESAPLDPARFGREHPVIGIFTPKAVSWPKLADVIADCRQHFGARRIVIRWHPSMLEPPRLGRVLNDVSGIIESPAGAALPDVARQCDWVIGDENSGVHLPVLKLGIPTVGVKHLGLYSRTDMYGFARDGVVLPPVAAVRDVQAEALTRFYSDGWAARFERYDAGYLRSDAVIGAEVRRAILALSSPVRSTSGVAV
ncbi:MAG: hypothetical protein A3F70_11705 [Acidobacteria bacterium RIFCSPLOWO2_12_FULL_67_14]|nr:MAG: hypothetical protein A3H29_06390 [Acidobacteria bacterium RIFCSPLOWO2_02_FULL_67_21]OFW36579.1 MAG: hypothetical protein A3F70_11705 [Acidobacteria bacterium RIFCSPLOWO2_12_FULL_67_14]